jgi:hypothetical protein
MKWFSLWSWLLIRAMSFPPEHVWHNRRFTLEEWHRGATSITRQFDIVFWAGPVLGLILGLAYITF